jgi:hypothetical protein
MFTLIMCTNTCYIYQTHHHSSSPTHHQYVRETMSPSQLNDNKPLQSVALQIDDDDSEIVLPKNVMIESTNTIDKQQHEEEEETPHDPSR